MSFKSPTDEFGWDMTTFLDKGGENTVEEVLVNGEDEAATMTANKKSLSPSSSSFTQKEKEKEKPSPSEEHVNGLTTPRMGQTESSTTSSPVPEESIGSMPSSPLPQNLAMAAGASTRTTSSNKSKSGRPKFKPSNQDFCAPPEDKSQTVRWQVYNIKGTPKMWDGRQWRKICVFQRCARYAVLSDFCKAHGGGKRCAHVFTPDESASASSGSSAGAQKCKRSAVDTCNVGTMLCLAHGGGTRCSFGGGGACHKSAADKTGLCKAHGGGRRCNSFGCTKSAVSPTDLCISHGGGKRCTYVDALPNGTGAASASRSNIVVSAAGLAIVPCKKAARGITGFCAMHNKSGQCAATHCADLSDHGNSIYCIKHSNLAAYYGSPGVTLRIDGSGEDNDEASADCKSDVSVAVTTTESGVATTIAAAAATAMTTTTTTAGAVQATRGGEVGREDVPTLSAVAAVAAAPVLAVVAVAPQPFTPVSSQVNARQALTVSSSSVFQQPAGNVSASTVPMIAQQQQQQHQQQPQQQYHQSSNFVYFNPSQGAAIWQQQQPFQQQQPQQQQFQQPQRQQPLMVAFNTQQLQQQLQQHQQQQQPQQHQQLQQQQALGQFGMQLAEACNNNNNNNTLGINQFMLVPNTVQQPQQQQQQQQQQQYQYPQQQQQQQQQPQQFQCQPQHQLQQQQQQYQVQLSNANMAWNGLDFTNQ